MTQGSSSIAPSLSGNTSQTSSSATSTSASPTVVASAAGFANRGLYNDPSSAGSSPLLSVSVPSSSAMSVAICASACQGYNYFGLENGNQCYCGNTLSSQPTSAADQSGGSDVVCSGDNTELCGGLGLLRLYTSASVSSSLIITSTVGPTSSSGLSSVTSQTSSSATVSPTVVQSASGYVVQPVYVDPTNSGTVLTTRLAMEGDMTAALCANLASSYAFFGLSGGMESFSPVLVAVL